MNPLHPMFMHSARGFSDSYLQHDLMNLSRPHHEIAWSTNSHHEFLGPYPQHEVAAARATLFYAVNEDNTMMWQRIRYKCGIWPGRGSMRDDGYPQMWLPTEIPSSWCTPICLTPLSSEAMKHYQPEAAQDSEKRRQLLSDSCCAKPDHSLHSGYSKQHLNDQPECLSATDLGNSRNQNSPDNQKVLSTLESKEYCIHPPMFSLSKKELSQKNSRNETHVNVKTETQLRNRNEPQVIGKNKSQNSDKHQTEVSIINETQLIAKNETQIIARNEVLVSDTNETQVKAINETQVSTRTEKRKHCATSKASCTFSQVSSRTHLSIAETSTINSASRSGIKRIKYEGMTNKSKFCDSHVFETTKGKGHQDSPKSGQLIYTQSERWQKFAADIIVTKNK